MLNEYMGVYFTDYLQWKIIVFNGSDQHTAIPFADNRGRYACRAVRP
jgi:hypothetical protein